MSDGPKFPKSNRNRLKEFIEIMDAIPAIKRRSPFIKTFNCPSCQGTMVHIKKGLYKCKGCGYENQR